MSERYLAIKQNLSVRFYNITKHARPITRKKSEGLFRTDEFLMNVDRDGNFEFCMFDAGGTQPYGRGFFLNPDETKAFIESMKQGMSKPTNLSSWDGIGKKILLGIIVLVIGYAGLATVVAMI